MEARFCTQPLVSCEKTRRTISDDFELSRLIKTPFQTESATTYLHRQEQIV